MRVSIITVVVIALFAMMAYAVILPPPGGTQVRVEAGKNILFTPTFRLYGWIQGSYWGQTPINSNRHVTTQEIFWVNGVIVDVWNKVYEIPFGYEHKDELDYPRTDPNGDPGAGNKDILQFFDNGTYRILRIGGDGSVTLLEKGQYLTS